MPAIKTPVSNNNIVFLKAVRKATEQGDFMVMLIADFCIQNRTGVQGKRGHYFGVWEAQSWFLLRGLRPDVLVFGGVWHTESGSIHHDPGPFIMKVISEFLDRSRTVIKDVAKLLYFQSFPSLNIG